MASHRVMFVFDVALAVVYLLSLTSCGQETNNEMVEDARKIAKIKCASRKLTEEKFVLAGRYAEIDQLTVERKVTPDSIEKIKYQLDQKKALLIQQSQDSSDKLLQFLRGVWQERYTTQSDRAMLDSLTELELRNICKMP
ncbi:hypothetical protein HRH25_17275 [Flavisolibacter sp. BT320]|nr:hypothetical protein [Flavisolibacter longurius]